jgi:hypothetical protein
MPHYATTAPRGYSCSAPALWAHKDRIATSTCSLITTPPQDAFRTADHSDGVSRLAFYGYN